MKGKKRTGHKRKARKEHSGRKTGAMWDPLGLGNLDQLMYANPVYRMKDPSYVLRKTAVFNPAPAVITTPSYPANNMPNDPLYAPTIAQSPLSNNPGTRDFGSLHLETPMVESSQGLDVVSDSSMMARMSPFSAKMMLGNYPGLSPYTMGVLNHPMMQFSKDFELKDTANVVSNNMSGGADLPGELLMAQSKVKQPGVPGFVPPPQVLAVSSKIQL